MSPLSGIGFSQHRHIEEVPMRITQPRLRQPATAVASNAPAVTVWDCGDLSFLTSFARRITPQ